MLVVVAVLGWNGAYIHVPKKTRTKMLPGFPPPSILTVSLSLSLLGAEKISYPPPFQFPFFKGA
jgi:hypothetical protein